jgi:hypothetical protein
LSKASDGIRTGAAQILADWLKDEQPAAWSEKFKPVFIDIWPLDRKYRNEGSSRELAKFALAAGEAFPDAFDTIHPYLVPLTDAWPQLHFFTVNRGPEILRGYPEKVLSLLWCLLRPPEVQGRSSDLPEILNALKDADQSLALDRRLQLLEERALRH